MPALLVVVATLGVARSMVLGQSSWQGVSFGMFARYDNAVSRAVHVTVDSRDGPVGVSLPSALRDDAFRLRVVPTDAGARRLASAVLRLVPAGSGRRVAVEVWRIKLDGEDRGLQLKAQRLARGEASR